MDKNGLPKNGTLVFDNFKRVGRRIPEVGMLANLVSAGTFDRLYRRLEWVF